MLEGMIYRDMDDMKCKAKDYHGHPIFFICDRKACIHCWRECRHTCDIYHSVTYQRDIDIATKEHLVHKTFGGASFEPRQADGDKLYSWWEV